MLQKVRSVTDDLLTYLLAAGAIAAIRRGADLLKAAPLIVERGVADALGVVAI